MCFDKPPEEPCRFVSSTNTDSEAKIVRSVFDVLVYGVVDLGAGQI
jgi:hypothetical protein